jgi:nucleoside phosphorylase
MSDDTEAFISAKQAERRRQEEAERQRQERFPIVRRITTALDDLRNAIHEYRSARPGLSASANTEERDQLRGRVADAFLSLASRLNAEGEEYRLDREPSLRGPFWSAAQDLYEFGRLGQRDKLLARLKSVEEMPEDDQSDLWKHVVWFTEQILDHTEAMVGVPLFGRHARRARAESGTPATGAGEELLAASSSMPLDPSVQAILDKERASHQKAAALQQALEEAEARRRRVHEAWLRVCQFRGDRIPAELARDDLHRRYAELIVELGRVLKADGWQDRVDAVQADTDPKAYALAILRKAMEDDTAAVTGLLREGVFGGGTSIHFGLEANGWLCEGLMYEVLNIRPAPEPPLGWEGSYLEGVEKMEDLINWIDREFLVHQMAPGGRLDRPSDGRLVRNAFRLIMKLGLKGMPLEPYGPFLLNDELTVLRNLKRLCLERQQAGAESEMTPTPTIGFLTALDHEFVAMKAMLDNPRDFDVPGAGVRYVLGQVPGPDGIAHTVVLALGDMGESLAAIHGAQMLHQFPTVKQVLMVGIAGGVPHPTKAAEHVRLGDIVVSDRYGVVQFDFVKQTTTEVQFRAAPRPPSHRLLHFARHLNVGLLEGRRPWEEHLRRGLEMMNWSRPPEASDILGQTDDPKTPVPHPIDPKRLPGQPRVFFGLIASSNTLLKDPVRRDALRDRFQAKAIEMETAGLSDAAWFQEVGYLGVRAICDYCDANKNDAWQLYAAMAAAAYVRALLESMPGAAASVAKS